MMDDREEGEVTIEDLSTSSDSIPSVKKSRDQMNFFKDRITGLYKCQMCSYKSMHRSSIKSHYAVHSSLRPFACDHCSYEAKRLNDLRKHKMIKHGKKLIPVRKKHGCISLEANQSLSNGLDNKSPKYAESDNNDSHMEDQDVDGGSTGNLLYQSLLGGGSSSNGPVFPQPEPASVIMSSPDTCNTNSPLRHERSISTGDIPDEVDKEGTLVVKPEPPDDYYTFQNRFPEHDDPIVIPSNLSTNPDSAVKSVETSPSPRSLTSPVASLKSVAQSTSKEESEVTRLHAASPSVISLLLQRRNLTGSTLHQPTSSQPKPLKPTQRSSYTTLTSQPVLSNISTTTNPTATFYTVPDSLSRFSTPQYNPLNLSYQVAHQAAAGAAQGPTRSNSECSSHSSSLLPSSTSGRSRGVETTRGWTCDHCNIIFFDSAIYFMHMGLHNPDNAWQCNLCAQQFYDVYSFTSHFVNGHVAA